MLKFNYHLNIKGVNIDRLIENIYSKQIKIKNLKRFSHTEIDFYISKSDYLKLEKFLESFDVTINDVGIKKVKAIAFSLLTVWIAIPIILFFAIICSSYIWKIEINGLNSITKQEVNEILLQKNLVEHGEFAQVSCYFRGTTLIINVSEKLVFTPIEYEPITAKYNGIILDYNLKKGTINFVKGEFVKKGDILVYPYIMDKLGNKIQVEPDCEIEAKIYLTVTNTIHQKETILVPSGKTKTITNILFNDKLFSHKDVQPFVFYEKKVYNNYISSVLPFKKQTVIYYELVQQEKINNLALLQSELEEKTLQECEAQMDESLQLISSSVSSQIVDNILFTSATIVCSGAIV